MTEEQTTNEHGATPGKLALIGLLSLVLLAVVYWNFFHEAAAETTSARNERASNTDANSDEKTKNGGEQSGNRRRLANERVRLHARPWPEYKLAEVVGYNPFTLPDAFPRPRKVITKEGGPLVASSMSDEELTAERQAAAETRATAITAIRDKGVQVILQNEKEYVAIIDGRELRVNDDLNGFTVVHIGNDGITLEEGTK